jgi:two-component system CheB/CheR fusion protein
MLTIEGHHVLEASDGPSAIEAARVFRPQLVLLDIGLPGMDGFEVAKRLRQCPETRGAVLVAVTGYAEPEILRRSREAGFSRHLVKPVEMAELLELVGACAVEWPDELGGVYRPRIENAP